MPVEADTTCQPITCAMKHTVDHVYLLRSPPGSRSVRRKVGSDFWMAPEVYSTGKTFQASDVFSLHVVMWEVRVNRNARGRHFRVSSCSVVTVATCISYFCV